jgi:hypothetical protein
MFPHILKISNRIAEKLQQKHNVTREEVWQCFLNRTKGLLEDARLDHHTDPPTFWFIAATDYGRLLKIVSIKQSDGTYEIKTAYEPNDKEVKIYEKYA